jgi:hypothetical protein
MMRHTAAAAAAAAAAWETHALAPHAHRPYRTRLPYLMEECVGLKIDALSECALVKRI